MNIWYSGFFCFYSITSQTIFCHICFFMHNEKLDFLWTILPRKENETVVENIVLSVLHDCIINFNKSTNVFFSIAVPDVSEVEEKMKVSNEAVFLKSLEGFLLVLSPEGDFVYLSENVNEYLGITQVSYLQFSKQHLHYNVNNICRLTWWDRTFLNTVIPVIMTKLGKFCHHVQKKNQMHRRISLFVWSAR